MVMETVPRNIGLDEVRQVMCGIDGVEDVVVSDLCQWTPQLRALTELLQQHFDINHPTLQAEPVLDKECIAGCD